MLHVHRSESAAALVEALAALLAAPPEDPFERDVVAVPARGVERWITQRLSARLGAGGSNDGVCALVDFPRPDDVLAGALAAVSAGSAAAVEAWQPQRAVWPVLVLLDEVVAGAADQRFTAVRRHLEGGRGRRYPLARHVADLFSAYGEARPRLALSWAAGRDDDVPEDLRWQPELWRRLRERVGPSPAELLDEACAALRADPAAVDLPARVNLFGATRLGAAQLQVLSALAAGREVHLWVHSASPVMWEGVLPPVDGSLRRADAPTWSAHPLLASLSRDVRELQLRLTSLGIDTDTHHPPADRRSGELLTRLQSDLRNDRVGAPRMPLGPADRSVQVHACHGRARQVEVLREVLVGLMADDPTLEPRDVLVMCPDVEAYAPLVTAVFGAEGHPGGGLRVSLADRSPRRVNPLLDVAATLLAVAAGRVPATQVLDLAGTEPVRLRFGLDDDDLEQLRSWAVSAGIRWGLSAAHREGWQLGALDQGTWRQGLDRLLAGVALEQDDALLGGVLPVDEVDSSAIDLAGRFAEYVDRLEAAVTTMGGQHPVGEWLDLLERSVDELAAVPADRQWQSVGLRAEFQQVRAAAAGSAAPLGLAEITGLLTRRLEGRPTTAGFRTGGLTVCTLTPMRSVPHRVVCLLGMDDGAFPRQGSVDGDDLLLRDPLLGERDLRSEDRQLFLDALCAAGEHLVVTYSGADVRTGADLPPAVPVGELLDALDACAEVPGGRRARDAVVVRHPLQPFDRRNFTADDLGAAGRPFSFDGSWLAGARAAAGERASPEPLVGAPLPPAEASGVVELAALSRFWQNPSAGWLRQRLDVDTTSRDQDPDDALPVEPDALEKWKVADRVLQARLRGVDVDSVRALERARGALPPPPLGDLPLAGIGPLVDRLVRESAAVRTGPAQTLAIDADIPGGRRLIGSVRGVHDDVLLTVTYSRVRPKQRLRAWLDLIALTAATPGRQWRAQVLGRAEEGDDLALVTLGPVQPETARHALADLVALRELGLQTPLPLPVGAGEAYARLRAAGRDPDTAGRAASRCWSSGWQYDGEDRDPAHVLVWGEAAAWSALQAWAAPPGSLPGEPGEPTDLGRVARAVWQPLLDAESRRTL